MLLTDTVEKNYSNLISNYILKKIRNEINEVNQEQTNGKFILRDYDENILSELVVHLKNIDDLLIIVDNSLQLDSLSKNIILATQEEMAQYRNESVKNSKLDLEKYNFILFLTSQTIDTLNDITTLTYDDIRKDFDTFIDIIDHTNLNDLSKDKLKNIVTSLWSEIEEISEIQMSSFISSTLSFMDDYPIEEALGLSFDQLDTFKCRTFLDTLKNSTYLSKDLSKVMKNFKKISEAFTKKSGGKSVDNITLKERFEDNKDEFELLNPEKLALINFFINANSKEIIDNKNDLNKLDWYEDKLYKLFEKEKSQASDKLGSATIELLESYDFILEDQEKNILKQYDNLKSSQRETLKNSIESIYQKYRQSIETDITLRNKWDKYLYPQLIKSNNFIIALINTIKKIQSELPNSDILTIEVKLKYQATSAIIKNYSKHAIFYLCRRYSVLNRVSNNIIFNFSFISEIENRLEKLRNDKHFKGKQRDEIEKFDRGSASKSQNELHFFVEAKDKSDQILLQKKFIWSYNPNSILNGFYADTESIIQHLKKKKIYNSIAYQATNSEKGESKSLSLYDHSSLKARGSNQGYKLFPKSENSLGKANTKSILTSAKELISPTKYQEFESLIFNFQELYLSILEELDVKNNFEKTKFDFTKIQEFADNYTNLCTFLYENCDDDKFKNNVIEPFLSLITVTIDSQDTLIIPSYHPLRLISYFVKLKETFNFIDKFIASSDLLINDELFFSDIEHNFETTYYPEIFRLFNRGDEETSFLQQFEIFEDYSILEPIRNFLDHGQASDPTEQASILTKIIENYLDLNKHKKSSIKILLHAIKNYNFPLKLMQKLSTLDPKKKPNNIEIYLNDLDISNIRKLYRTFLVNQNSPDNEELLEDNEVSFLSNVRLNALDQNFSQLETINDQINISYLNDFISTKAKVVFTQKIFQENINLFDYNPTQWTKRRYITRKEDSIGKYLIPPADCSLTEAFYNLLFITFSTQKNQYLNFIPALMIDRSKYELREELSMLHLHSDWVVNLDSLLDKKILEEFKANVIKYRKARHINRNLVVSSKANTLLLKGFLKKKFQELNINSQNIETIVENVISSANELSGDIILKAIGQGKFTNELLGLVLTKTIIEKSSNDKCILIYLDDYSDWFFKRLQSEDKLAIFTENALSDILSITPVFNDKNKLCSMYIDIIEIKYCNKNIRSESAQKSFKQVKNTFETIQKVFDSSQFEDKEYWLGKISDLIIETYNKGFDNDITSESIRNDMRTNRDINYIVRGMSFVFIYDDNDNDLKDNVIKQYFLGSQIISKILEDIKALSLNAIDVDFPKYDFNFVDLPKNNFVESKNVAKDNIETLKTVTIDSQEKNQAILGIVESNIVDKQIQEENNFNEVITSIKQVIMHYGFKAKVKGHLYTPNSLRISLEPEMGWKPKMFYDMQNDLLTVKELELLRVEPVKGAYDLVFKRNKREVVRYQDCIDNREISDGPGNTKIVLGKDEQDDSIVYYNLNSEDPHALIGGMTKSGKSVLLNVIIIDLIKTNDPDDLKLILIDPKQVEFTRYKRLPYLDQDGIITTKEKAMEKLETLVEEMERRYRLFSIMSVNEINKYNRITEKKLARIVVIFDEFADWMLDDDFKRTASSSVQRLSGKARAAGIHLIISTQRPDNSVVVPILRANLGAKLALRVDSEKNSLIILDESGAEKLLGYGHMIAKFAGEKRYIQTAFISDDYIEEVLKSYK